MNDLQARRLQRRLRTLQARLGKVGPFMRGTVVVIGTTRRKHPYLSLSHQGKTQLIYLGEERAKLARQLCRNYSRLTDLIEETTQVQMALLKANRLAKPPHLAKS
jgi:hypothetical protein